jgi:hypothetical protein
MSKRVTESQLQSIVDRLNRLTGNPAECYTKGEDGRLHANIGNYHLSFAYGGVALHQMVTDGGGVREPLYTGHIPKRELAERLYSFIYGIQTAQDATKTGV